MGLGEHFPGPPLRICGFPSWIPTLSIDDSHAASASQGTEEISGP